MSLLKIDNVAAALSVLSILWIPGCGEATTAVHVSLPDSKPVYAAYRSDGAWTRP